MKTIYKRRRQVCVGFGAILLLFMFSWGPAAKTPKTEEGHQISIFAGATTPVALGNTSDKDPLQNIVAKAHFVANFIAVNITDTPSAEISTNPAVTVNRYFHNVFYVLLTAKAP